MKAARIHKFGPPEVVVVEDLLRPNAGTGELLVRVKAAGVAPWDAIIREGRSKVSPPPPLTLGSDLSGIVEEVGPGVTKFHIGDEVYGVTNAQFCGANAEFAAASSGMVAKKPRSLSHLEAASVPVVAVTAWQMLFEYAHVVAGQSILILGAGGNVGAYAVQFAAGTSLNIVAIGGSKDLEFIRSLGAETALDYRAANFDEAIPQIDVLIDTVGGETLERSFGKLKPGGILVSVVAQRPPQRTGVRSVFFYADVTTARLGVLTKLFEDRKLSTRVGSFCHCKTHGLRTICWLGRPINPAKLCWR